MATSHPGDARSTPALFFFVNGHKVDAPQTQMTGAAIKQAAHAVDPSTDVSHELVLEATGQGADRLIRDDEVVNLEHGHGQGPKHFFTRPPTNFGAR